MNASSDTAGFDQYATNYHDQLKRGLSLTGEDPEYFARARVEVLRQRLTEIGARPKAVLDFGCGTGSTVPLLLDLAGVEGAIGTDASAASLAVARVRHDDTRISFQALDQVIEDAVDLAYCNGVFHHIPPPERPAALRYVARALRPGGLLALWENNSWNPGTRMVMHRIPFDRDASPLSPLACKRMLREGGFDVVRTDFAFIFPHSLRALRPVERYATRLPVGGQYMVLARPRDSLV
jgi:SAM-dependent methyltransferase